MRVRVRVRVSVRNLNNVVEGRHIEKGLDGKVSLHRSVRVRVRIRVRVRVR